MTGFCSCHKTDRNFKSLYGFGGRCLKIRDVCMDFQPYFKVHNLVPVHPESIILGQLTNLNIFLKLITNTIVTIQYQTPLSLITMLIYITLLTVPNNYTTYSIQLY